MKRLFALGAVLAALLAIPSAVSATGAATCAYSGTNHKVTVAMTGGQTSTLSRDASGHIKLDGVWCQGAATVTNTDTVVVTGDASNQTFYINIASGGFQPGFTDEAGSSDEIEFNINLGGSASDQVGVIGMPGVTNKIDLGQQTTGIGVIVWINLNSGETTGIDADVGIQNTESIVVFGSNRHDVIRARGKKGTGPDPLGIPLWAHGDSGGDVIKGGEAADHLWGDDGKDTLYGFGGPDDINMNDGAGGDVGYGGADFDTAIYESTDTWHQD